MIKAAILKMVQRTSSFFPGLKRDIRIAHIMSSPQEFIYNNFKFSLPFSLVLTLLFFFIVDKAKLSLALVPLSFVVFFILVFYFGFLKIKSRIVKRQKEIDREVLFAGQYLLIKLYAGKPLLNALIDTSRSYGVASKYIKEIVDDIDTGSSLENALENAMTYSPSEKFRRILFHVNNALRLGIDVTGPLNSVLEEITREQEIEIQRYGKKLNSIIVFYMLGAVVIPSIGMTIFIVITSFVKLELSITHFVVAIWFIAAIQVVFMAIFKSIRPVVNV